MARRIATGLLSLAAMLLASYSPNIPLPWSMAMAATPEVDLPTINKPAQGKVWVCPMHPEIMQDHPGACPICGMDLVEAKEHAGHEQGVRVDSATMQKLGVRLAGAKRMSLGRNIRTYGNVMEDGGTVYNIHSKVDGLIEKTYINTLGQKIEKGQVIYEIYSPELIAQQKEFIRFIERRDQLVASIGDARFQENEYLMNLLQEFSRERTRFLHEDVAFDVVQQVEDSKMIIETIKIVAAQSGVVTRINAREGSYVMPSATLFTLADTAKIWVDIALYPDQTGQVQVGDEVLIRTADGRKVKSRIDFISPVAENNKVIARATLDNDKLKLRPGSYADVLIRAQQHEALALPRSAVLRTGDGDRVMLSRGDGHFLPVPVETGVESGDWIEIIDGLAEGAEVAVNGQFLLDAAASLNAAAQRMQESHAH